MQILLLSPLPPPNGGIARWSETVITGCRERGDVDLIHIDTGHRVKDIVNRSFWQRFIRPFFRMFAIRREIRAVCRRQHIDVAHITTSAEYGLLRDRLLIAALRRRRIKIVYHLHFGRYAAIKQANTPEYRALDRLMKKVDLTLAMDPVTFDAIDPALPKAFVPNPIPEEPYCPADSHTVVFLGYVVKTKGVEELLQAWDRLALADDWQLKVIGQVEPGYLTQLKKNFSCRRVTFTGEVDHDQAMTELQNASVFVLPSYTEGFPYSVCEAMFAGKAVIASRVGAIAYMLEDDSGLLCAPRDVPTLENALRRAMTDGDLRTKLGQRASARARRLFTVDAVTGQYVALWTRLCKADNGTAEF